MNGSLSPMNQRSELFFDDCFHRANASAGAAAHALSGVDGVGGIASGDCFNGAFASAGSASNALVSNFVSHGLSPWIDAQK
jgi:hypothetical protein